VHEAGFLGAAPDCAADGRRRNGGGAAGNETEGTARCAGGKTGKRAAESPKSLPYNHRSSQPAVYFFPSIATSKGPLSTKQKFELFAGESVAPSRFLSSAAGAGIDQARDSLGGYGQEIGGYGKRFGSSMATAASNNFFGTFVISSVLHRDPRYFVTLHGGVGRRIGYALSRIVVARTDEGKDAANWAGILGPLLAESLANCYLPVKEQTADRTFERYGIRIGLNTSSNALREYWPTIFRSLRITKIAPELKSDPTATAPAATRPSPGKHSRN
jgi:hypothetical protein